MNRSCRPVKKKMNCATQQFSPIFAARSYHRYDTDNYLHIDPALGGDAAFHRYPTDGACESLTSVWRSWFHFNDNNVPCNSSDYTGWFGFDSLPTFDHTNPAVQNFFTYIGAPMVYYGDEVAVNSPFSFTVMLQASRNGSDTDGGHYIINVTAEDYAGNTGSASAVVNVPHDQGH